MKSILSIDDRIVTAELCGQTHELLMSTLAVKQIAKKFGSIEKMNTSDIDNVFWILTTLINAAAQYRNLRGETRPLIRQDFFDDDALACMMPYEWRSVIEECVQKGMHRHIESDDNGKNGSPA